MSKSTAGSIGVIANSSRIRQHFLCRITKLARWCGVSGELSDTSQGATGFSEGWRTHFLSITLPEGMSVMELPQVICIF